MKKPFASLVAVLCFGFSATQGIWAQQVPYPTPDANPESDIGALKAQVTTGGSYDVQSGNATRTVNDLRVPGALGEYGLDFTRYWNSVHGDDTNFDAEWPLDFAFSGWSHSWRWTAIYGEERPIFEPGPGAGIWTTSITINFPDGHATKFKITRTNNQNGWHNPSCGPPYDYVHNERDWPKPALHVHDRLVDMAEDGSEFWLSRADGGSVHFVGVDPWTAPGGYLWWFYEAREVYDPHGVRTELIYTNGSLTQVKQDGGRLLNIHWAGVGTLNLPVIGWVESGGDVGQAPQRVTYNYTPFGTNDGMYVLAGVTYQNDPAPGQTSVASYTYSVNYRDGLNPASWRNTFPLLKTADDPHYDGAMTKISYKYWGENCPGRNYPPFDPPDNYYEWFYFSRETIIEERNEAGTIVSRFEPQCEIGTRKDHNGIGGWRKFFYGQSAGDTTIGAMGYELTKVTDFGRESNYTLANVPSRKQRGTEPPVAWDGRGIPTERSYLDDSGKPSEVRYVDGSSCTYERVNSSPPSATPDPGRIHNKQHHWLFSETDELDQTTTYTRDGRRRVTHITYPGGSSEGFLYNDFNQVTRHTLASGANVFYEYDQFNRLQREYNSVDLALDGHTSDKVYTYDANGRVETMTEGRAAVTPNALFTVKMTYNGRGQVMSVEYPSTPDGTSAPTVRYEYDRYGNCKAITDELGHRREYTYDSYRRCTSYTEPVNGPCGVTNRTWNWIYDRVIVDDDGFTAIGHFKPSAHTSKEWRMQVEPVFNSLGERRVTARTFDVNNRIRSEQTGLIQAPGAALGSSYAGPNTATHRFSYDENGQKKSYTDAKTRVTTYEYNDRNRLSRTTEYPAPSPDPTSPPRVTETQYDVAGNKTQVTFPDLQVQKWEEYDAFGQAWRFRDERNNVTDLTYQWGPMKKLGTVKTYRVKDGVGESPGGTEAQETSFDYDQLGRPIEVEFPDESKEISTYKYGQLKTWKTRRGQTKTITEYDARGREWAHTWSNDARSNITRTWDAANRMLSIANSFSTIGYEYDAAGQVKVERNTVAGSGGLKQLTYCRYPNGEVSSVSYPDGTVVGRNYTARGQLKDVHWGTGSTSYDYLQDGKVNYQAYTNGVRVDYGYDGRGMISSILYQNALGQIAKRDYWRNERDRITAWKRGITAGQNGMENGRGDRYDYDPEGQLTRAAYRAQNPELGATSPTRIDSFAYDALGNRMGWNVIASRGGAMLFKRRNNGLNQYSSWENSYQNPPLHWGSAIYYDDNFGSPPAPSPSPPWISPANGVMMADGWNVASFNALNQPVAMWSLAYNDTPNYVWFGYDPLGRCVKRWIGPTAAGNQVPAPDTNPATYFYYDGWNLVQEFSTGTTNAARRYVHGGRVDEIVASFAASSNQWGFHHYDARGHCILLTGTSNNIIEQYDYDAFGMPYCYNSGGGFTLRVNGRPGSPWGNRFLFTAREWLSDLGVYDFRHRMYQPELGRFLQPDPKQFEAGDYNIYRYCHNDPVNKSDPTGLLDVYGGVEADLVPIFGFEVGFGVVVDFSNLAESGIYGSFGGAGGGSAGVGAGGGFAVRDVEGPSLNGDVNLGKVSVTASMDEEGFNGMGASVGPGIGASASQQNTRTLTFKTIVNWIKEKVVGKEP